MKSSLTKVSLALLSTSRHKEAVMRPFIPFATLLSAVFFLGCQEQGPTAPEAQPPVFAKAPPSGSPTYDVTHTGEVTTAPPSITGRRPAGKNSQQVVLGGAVAGAIVFSDAFADGLGDPSGNCFPRNGDDPTTATPLSGALMPDKRNPSKVIGNYFFTA